MSTVNQVKQPTSPPVFEPAIDLVDGADLNLLRFSGQYIGKNPTGLTAGTYAIQVLIGKADGRVAHIQRATNISTGAEFTRVLAPFTGWSTWVEGGAGSGGLSPEDQAKLDNISVFNVLDYGALGDNNPASAATNRTAFEDAILAAEAVGGGLIYVPRGTYYINYGGAASRGGVRLRDNMTLAGDGIGNTVIKAADIGNNDMAGLVRTQSGITNENVTVRDLTIDGNKQGQTGWANIICFFAGVTPDDRVNTDKDIWCVNVECRNGKNGTTGSSNLSRGYGFDPHEVVERFSAVNCIAHDNERDGFVLDGVVGFSLVACKSWNNGRHGFNFITQTYNGLVSACEAWGNAGNNYMIQGDSHRIILDNCISRAAGEQGIRIRRGATVLNTHCIISNCIVETSARNGINLTGCNYNIVSNNLLLNNSASADDTYSDIVLDDDDGDTVTFTGADFNVVKNNYCVVTAATRARAGIREDDAATDPPANNVYEFNEARGHVSGKYRDMTSTAIIRDRGYLDVYNAEDHGVRGDNSTDNRVALRALVDLVAARGGGEILLPPGIIRASGTGTASQGIISLPSNVSLRGRGMGVTTLLALDPVNNDITGVVRTRSGAANVGVMVRDLTIGAQAVTGTGSVTLLYVGGSSDSNHLFENVEVYGGEDGSANTGYGVRVVTGNCTFVNVIARNNDRDGFYCDAAANVKFVRPVAYSNGRHNFNVSNSGAANILVMDPEFYDATTNGIFVAEDAERVTVRGGTVRNSGQDGVRVRRGATTIATRVILDGVTIRDNQRDGVSIAGASHNTVRNCSFRSNGLSANNTYSDVSLELDGTHTGTRAEYNHIHNNTHNTAASTPLVDYIVAERTNAGSNNVVVDNAVVSATNPATGRYLLAASSTTVFRDHLTGTTPAGSDTQFQYNNSSAMGGASGLTYDSVNNRPNAPNGVILGQPDSIVAPSAGSIVPVAAARGGLILPAYINTRRRLLQNAIFESNTGLFLPSSTGTTGTGISVAYTGTASVAAMANTSKLASMRRININGASALSQQVSVVQSSRNLWRGNAASRGGFTCSLIWGIPNAQTAPRIFAGLAPSTSNIVNTANPSGEFNIFGVGVDAGETTLRLMHNDGVDTATKVNLGANFPITAGVMYELMLHSEPNGSSIEYFIRRLDAAHTASGTISTDLPADNIFYALQIGLDTAAATEAADLDFLQMYFEVPF